MPAASRFGASTSSPAACAAVLRATAARYGLRPVHVTDLHLSAACVAAEVWCHLHRTGTLGDPARLGAAAGNALAATVRLAAEGVSPPPAVPSGAPASPERFGPVLDRCRCWVHDWMGGDLSGASSVAALAAACVAAGGDAGHRAVADLLLLAADDWAERLDVER